MPKLPAGIVTCPGYESSSYEHSMRDFCSTCASFWEKVPVCPTHGKKLTTTGFCKVCRKHYDITGV